MNGATLLHSFNEFQSSTYWNHRESLMSCKFILSAGFLTRSPYNNTLRLSDNCSGNIGYPNLIWLNNSARSAAMNGGYPTTISYMMHPNDHQSTFLSCAFSCRISGAKYSGVPTMDLVDGLFSRIFDNPKSVSLMYPFLSNSTFSGLRLIIFKLTPDIWYYVHAGVPMR